MSARYCLRDDPFWVAASIAAFTVLKMPLPLERATRALREVVERDSESILEAACCV
jgi:hypothetical protein